MDYEGKCFKSTWKNNILHIRFRSIGDNTINLLRIIFEAAVDQENFNLAIDTRELETLGFSQLWYVGSFLSEITQKLNSNVCKISLLVPLKYHKTIGFIMKYAGPNCQYYITENTKDAKNFVS